MTTKIMIIVGVSVASVLALFVMGYFLDKKPRNKGTAEGEALLNEEEEKSRKLEQKEKEAEKA